MLHIINRPIRLTAAIAISLTLTWTLCSLAYDGSETKSRDANHVELKQIDGNWQLFRNGKPYYINGAGGDGSLTLLATCGGNSIRSWGADEKTQALLDEAQKNGLTVAFGIWLEHERHGFDYNNDELVAKQAEVVLEAVRKFKNHPAVLVWGIGNEMEGYEAGDNPKIWKHVEDLCQRIKREDPDHPVMSVIAEIGGNKIPAIHEYCPSLDIIGINSYAGASSIPERYRKIGGTKPYIVTEFGPKGTWEVGKNNLDSIDEPTSNAKAKTYAESFRSFKQDKQFCLGSYAFLWGNKQEATPTWFGMLLPNGKKTAAVDAMAKLWKGEPLTNLSPVIDELKIDGPNNVKANDLVKITLKARDPEGATLNTTWVLLPDSQQYVTGGDAQATPSSIPGRFKVSSYDGATVKMPETSGLYRIYAYVDDGQGGAVGNVVVRVDGKPPAKTGTKVTLPYVVYDEDEEPGAYEPTGWMGDTAAIQLATNSIIQPKSGKTCMQCEFQKTNGWGGIVWQNPGNDWGDQLGGLDLTGAKKLTFWVRGDKGGEQVKFGFGLIGRDKEYYDTAKKEMEVRLETEWRQVTFDLSKMELQRIKTGFFWVVAGQGEPLKFYIDRVVYE
ncbi:MAG: hypothetical protein MK106_04690 [Mariniblastus sp.]|nr:hypothetical protein [Mariniblastus sp.]